MPPEMNRVPRHIVAAASIGEPIAMLELSIFSIALENII